MQGSKEQQLVLPLIILTCQVRDAIEILPDAADIKYVSQRYDLCQQSLSQVRDVFNCRFFEARNFLILQKIFCPAKVSFVLRTAQSVQ